MIKELVIKNRSIRRYDNTKKLTPELLCEFVDTARFCASAGNRQRIRYAIVTECENLRAVRQTLGFAAYLKGWGGPNESENPTGYIVMLSEDEDFNLYVDIGIAASSMLLLATEKGLGGCIFRSFNKERIAEILGTDKYVPRLVVSLGVPGERVELDSVTDGDIRYYRRDDDVHVVPKLSLDEILITKK